MDRSVFCGLSMLAATALSGCGSSTAPTSGASPADRRLIEADKDDGVWITTGHTYDEARYSRLEDINEKTVGSLGIAWSHDLGTARGQEATPIVVDRVLYTSLAWSVVRAFDAVSGKPLWTYDPHVPRDTLAKACCDAVNRGVAYWDGFIFVGTLDGRLVALDAKTGKKRWSIITVDQTKSYTITGAPRVVQGKVIIGNAGAELGVRGYVSAYDARSGKLDWRFYTVPGDPAKPAENPILKRAMTTWKGEYWKQGGGGTAWDAFAYDPELDLLYIGTGNGSPWARSRRSPGGGDNLFLSSIVAVRPKTGEYVWHYQTTPGDDWDYTATQHMILADLKIGNVVRQVIMQAPKNGFFYVLDRKTGKLISAEKFVPVNWASKIDLKTGRPVENPAARYDETGVAFAQWPSGRGAHSWQPMSLSHKTGLVYIPVQETPQVFEADKHFVPPHKRGWNTATLMTPSVNPALPAYKAYLLAWDPVHQREAWRAQLGASGGGVLSTAGNLVFQGDGHAGLAAYRADTGKQLWSADVQGSAMAAPITYKIDGQQHVAVMVGCGGDFADQCGLVEKGTRAVILDRLIVFRLGAKQMLPKRPDPIPLTFQTNVQSYSLAAVQRGKKLFEISCAVCHGSGAASFGLNPDLRTSPVVGNDAFFDVVLGGALKDAGMASFSSELSREQVADIQSYIMDRTNADAKADH